MREKPIVFAAVAKLDLKMYVAFVLFWILITAAKAPEAVQGDVLKNEANEFYLGFGSNYPPPSEKVDLILSVTTSSLDPVMFTVDTLTDYTYSGNVSLNSPAKVAIPLDFMVTNASSSQRQKGIHLKVEKNKTVAVFGLNHNELSTDAYMALPCSHLPVMQYEYYAVTYDVIGAGNRKPFVLLVGCENSTTITTVLYNFTLNRLETHLMFITGTGARFVSDKPIAFFSGHQCAYFVYERCEHLIEQLPPTSTWGTFFLDSTGFSEVASTAFYRVFAAHDETTITVNCTSADSDPAAFTITTGGMYKDFDIRERSPPAFCVIEASKPVLVMEFQSSQLLYGWLSFMSLLPPTDQYNNHYSLPNFELPYDDYDYYATISVLPQYFDKKKIYIGNSIVSTQWTSVKCSNGTICGYITTLSQTAGQFIKHIDSDAKIGAITYGFGNWDAYGCPAGFHIGPFNQPVSSSTDALTSSTRILPSTTQLQPVETSQAPQPSYFSTLHSHTTFPSSPQYKPTVSTPEFTTQPVPTNKASTAFCSSISHTISHTAKPEISSVIPSATYSEHTTTFQTASEPVYTLSVSPKPTNPARTPVGEIVGISFGVMVIVTVCCCCCCCFLRRKVCPKENYHKVPSGESEEPNCDEDVNGNDDVLGPDIHASAVQNKEQPNCGEDVNGNDDVLSPDIHASAVQKKEQPNCDQDVNGNDDILSPSIHASAIQNKGRLMEQDLFQLTDILKPAALKWKEIGGKLNIKNSDLDIIEHKPTLILEGVEGYFREMLAIWLRWAPPKHSWPTIQNLMDAVRSSGHEDLAVQLQNYSPTTEINSMSYM